MNAVAVIYVNQHLEPSGRGPQQPNGLAGPPSAASAIAIAAPRPELRRIARLEASGPGAPDASGTIPTGADLLLSPRLLPPIRDDLRSLRRRSSCVRDSPVRRGPPRCRCRGASSPSGSRARQAASGITAAEAHRRGRAAGARRGEQRRSRRQARFATDGHRQRPATAVVLEDHGVASDPRSTRPSNRGPAPTRAGMSPPTTRTDRRSARRRAPRAARPAGLRTRPASWTSGRPAGTAGLASGRGDDEDLGRDRPDRVDRAGRAAVDRRSARPACRGRTGSTGRRPGR